MDLRVRLSCPSLREYGLHYISEESEILMDTEGMPINYYYAFGGFVNKLEQYRLPLMLALMNMMLAAVLDPPPVKKALF